MTEDYEIAHGAIQGLKEGQMPDDTQVLALSELVALFKPYEGDSPEELDAEPRKIGKLHCSNCGFVDHAPATPALMLNWARTAQRRSVCPRCFCTSMVMGDASA